MCRGEDSSTLLHGDFGDASVIKAPEIDACKIVQNRRWRAAKLVKRGIADNAEHPGAIGRRIARDPTSGERAGRRFLHKVTGRIGIASMVRANA